MALIKRDPTAVQDQIVTPPAAAQPMGRDFNKEARGKTRCAMYQAALQSQILAQLFYAKATIDLEDVKRTARELADDGVRYTFEDKAL